MAFLLKNLLHYRNSIAVNVIDDDVDYERITNRQDSFRPDFFRQMLDDEIYRNSGVSAVAPANNTAPSDTKMATETAKLNEIKFFLKDTNIFDTSPEDLKNPSLNGERYQNYQYRIRGISNLQEKMKINDTIAAIIASFGLLVAFIVNDVYIGNSRQTYSAVLILEILVSASTAILLCLIYRHHSIRHEMKKTDQITPQKFFWQTKDVKWFLAEVLINIIHLPPGVNYNFHMTILAQDITYSALDMVSIIMTLRAYLIFRLFALYSHWTKGPASYACQINECVANTGFALKAGFKERPYMYLVSTMFLGTVILGLCVRTVERPFYQTFPPEKNEIYMDPKYQDFNSVWNVFWLVFVTMATVGFGDYYPVTIFGRIIIAIAALAGIFNTSLVVYTLALSSSLDDSENKAFEVIRKLKEKATVRAKAANVIKRLIKLKALRNRAANNYKIKLEEELAEADRALEIAMISFRIAQDAKKDTNLSVDNQLKELIEAMKLDIKTVKADLIILEEISEKLNSIEDYNIRVIKKLNQEYSTLLYINKLLDLAPFQSKTFRRLTSPIAVEPSKNEELKVPETENGKLQPVSPQRFPGGGTSLDNLDKSPMKEGAYYESNLIKNIQPVRFRLKANRPDIKINAQRIKVAFEPSTPL